MLAHGPAEARLLVVAVKLNDAAPLEQALRARAGRGAVALHWGAAATLTAQRSVVAALRACITCLITEVQERLHSWLPVR